MKHIFLLFTGIILVQTILYAQNDLDNNHYCNKAHSAERYFNPLIKNNIVTQVTMKKKYLFNINFNALDLVNFKYAKCSIKA